MKNKLFYCLYTFFFFSFSQARSNDFILKGYCRNKAIKEIKIIKQNTLIDYEAPSLLAIMEKDSNDHFYCRININRLQYVDIVCGNITWKALIIPGANQTFSLNEQNQLIFEGDSCKYSNCLNGLHTYLQENNLKEPYFNENNTVDEYLSKLENFIKIKKEYVNNYEKNQKTSLPILTKSLIYEYAHLIYTPFLFKQNNINKIPQKYKNVLSIITFKNNSLVDDFFYTSAARDRYILINNKVEDVQNNFSKIYSSIISSSDGLTKEYLLAFLTTLYVNNNSVNADHTSFIKTTKFILKNLRDSAFIYKVNSNYVRFLFIDKLLPQTVLDETVLIEFGTNDRSTLRNMLSQFINNSVYIDFWASWCAPCRMDIKESEKSKLYLKKNNIITVYISIDSNIDLWKKASNDDNIQNNQFLLEKGSKSVLAKFLNLNSIPRYIVLDSDHKLKNLNAPRLNISSHEKLIQALQNLKSRRITYD